MLLHSAHIYGGNKLSHYEVLMREAEKGNERAINIIINLELKKENHENKYRYTYQWLRKCNHLRR